MTPAWLVPREHTIFRAVWVIVTFAAAARTIDLARGQWSLAKRLVHVLSVVDTRRLVRAPPALDRAEAIRAVLWGVLAGATYLAIPLAAHVAAPAYWAVRWLVALVFVYALSDAAYALAMCVYCAVGFTTPSLHIAPAAARSVQEFWGERWNRIVGPWLHDTFFRPLARRRHAALGALMAFVVSAVLHAYIVLVAASWCMAAVMLGFFVLQAAVIAVERVLRVRAWAPWAGHAWTVAWMAGLSPLFTEPMLQVCGV